MSEPWIVYAQTNMAPNTVKLNPSTHSKGLLGEATLPYVVPPGKILHVTKIGIEPLWGAAIIPYIGDSASATEATPQSICLKTFSSGGTGVNTTGINDLIASKVWDCDYYLPEGLKFNVRLSVGPNPGPNDSWVYGWCIHGELLDA